MTIKRRTLGAALRNGLKWRAGRPRWEPSPASRALGLKGLDLRRPDGGWMDRGEAIGAADARALWAAMIRAAAAGAGRGAAAAEDLREALDRLGPPPADETARQRRRLMEDLVDAARARLGEAPIRRDLPRPTGRTVERLALAYFAAADLTIAEATRSAYRGQSKRLVARFGHKLAGEVSRAQAVAWYRHLREDEGLSASNANQCLGAAMAIFAWGARAEPAWLEHSPFTDIRMDTAPGRRVFWSVADEAGFVAFADETGFADVADGIVAGLWTGARIGDICRANLSDMAGEVWLFTPQKTARRAQEAMPAIMAPVKERLERRRRQLVSAIDGAFLFDPRTGRRHDAGSFGARYAQARALFCAGGHAPADFQRLRVQDTRDTCITRLWEAGVPPARMWAWTGHSQRSIERILRDHYLVLRAEGSQAMAAQLADWARAQGVAL